MPAGTTKHRPRRTRTRPRRTREEARLLNTAELSARISLALQRTLLPHGLAPGRLTLGTATIDFSTRHVLVGARRLHRLTPKEFNLLGYLVANANKVLSDRELLQAVWGPEFGTEHERLRAVVSELRKKIEPHPSRPAHLITVPRVGYQLRLPRWMRS